MSHKIRVHTTPATTHRGICMALWDLGDGHYPYEAFAYYLDEVAQLHRMYPVQQLIRRKRSRANYLAGCEEGGHWDLSTRQGRARLTLWGAFLHWLETTRGDEFEVVS